MHTKLTNILLGGVCVDKARETARKRERGSVKEKDRECERVRQLKLCSSAAAAAAAGENRK